MTRPGYLNPAGPTMSFMWGYAAGYRAAKADRCRDAKQGSVHESAVANGETPNGDTP